MRLDLQLDSRRRLESRLKLPVQSTKLWHKTNIKSNERFVAHNLRWRLEMDNVNFVTFEFGKIAYWSNRKINPVTVDVEIRKHSSGEEYLSISGNIWNQTKTEVISCGQNLDTIKEKLGTDNLLFNRIYYFWEKYHLKYIDKIPKEDLKELLDLFKFNDARDYCKGTLLKINDIKKEIEDILSNIERYNSFDKERQKVITGVTEELIDRVEFNLAKLQTLFISLKNEVNFNK